MLGQVGAFLQRRGYQIKVFNSIDFSKSIEAKKMIVNCLIRRVEVYRDYRLHIDFNIDFEQFSTGLDISAIAA